MNINKLNSSNFVVASKQLSAAFSQDPLLANFLPKERSAKLATLKRISQALLNYAQPYNQIYTTEDLKGVAIWLPPEASQITLFQLWQAMTSGLLTVPFYMRWGRIKDWIALNITEIQLHSQITPEPHWYLAMLGVSPECQGQGIGGKLLQPVLQAADRSNIPCYLEGSSTANVRFYQRHGFEIAHQETFAGYEFWGMKRQPQTDTH